MIRREGATSRRFIVQVGASLVALFFGNPVFAQTWTTPQESANEPEDKRSHVELESDTSFMAYAISSPRSRVRLQRRRLVQWASLRHSALLGDEEPDQAWRLISRLSLRLDQEFGSACDIETERCLIEFAPEARLTYQPLYEPTRFEAVDVSVELQGPRSTSIRAGRQLLSDGILGFTRLDGLRVSSRPHAFVATEIYGGMVVRAGSFFAGNRFDPEGSLQLTLPDAIAPERVRDIPEPQATFTIGGRVELGKSNILRGAIAFRETRDSFGVVARRLGLSLWSRPIRNVGLRGAMVVDPSDGTLLDGLAEVDVAIAESSIRLRFERHTPRFDLGTIWAFFDLVPVDRASLTGSRGWNSAFGRLQLLARASLRRSHFPEDENPNEVDFGGEAMATLARRGWVTSLRSWVWGGSLSTVAAVALNVSKRLGRNELYFRGSIVHFDHPAQTVLYGTSLTGALGARVPLSDFATIRGEFEYSHNRVAGHRYRMLASLTLRAWR